MTSQTEQFINADPESLKLIQKTAVKAEGAKNKIEILKIDDLPNKTLVVNPDGTYETIDTRPPDKPVFLQSIAAIESTIASFDDVRFSLFVHRGGREVDVISEMESDTTRREFAKCILNTTSSFACLTRINGRSLTQTEFLKVFQFDLYDSIAAETRDNIIVIMKSLAFKAKQSEHSAVEKSKESLGADIENEITSQSGEDIPDHITFNMRIIDDPLLSVQYAIRCLVGVNIKERTFSINLFPESLERAVNAQTEAVEAALNNFGAEVYRGVQA